MTDNFPDEEFEPIAAAIKKLPYFAPSPHFADAVMARVRISGVTVPEKQITSEDTEKAGRLITTGRRDVGPAYAAPLERRSPAPVIHPEIRRSIPARIAATALVASVGAAMTIVTLLALFDLNIFMLVSRVFGQSTIAFLQGLAGDASASVASTAAASLAASGTAAGAAVIGSFAAGAIAATAGLRAAASSSRRAA